MGKPVRARITIRCRIWAARRRGCWANTFARRGFDFAAAYSGALARQQATGAGSLAGRGRSRRSRLGRVRSVAGLSRVRAAPERGTMSSFASSTKRCSRPSRRQEAAVHRKWNDCDKKCRAGLGGGPVSIFGRIVDGVRGARFTPRWLDRDRRRRMKETSIVFTSATPIGVCAARTLELFDGRAMWLAGGDVQRVVHHAARARRRSAAVHHERHAASGRSAACGRFDNI